MREQENRAAARQERVGLLADGNKPQEREINNAGERGLSIGEKCERR